MLSIVASKEDTTKILLRSIFFNMKKCDLVVKKAKEHNLYVPFVEWEAFSWPRICVKGEKKDIENFFEDLKYLHLHPTK